MGYSEEKKNNYTAKEKKGHHMNLFNSQRMKQTPPTIFSGFEIPDSINQTHGHTARGKTYIKTIKARADNYKVTVLLWNEL